MISFDQDEFWLILVTSEAPYRDYIRNHNSSPLPPSLTPPSLDEMARFLPFGPFFLGEAEIMQTLVYVLWAIMFRQIRENKKTGAEFLARLKSELK